MPYLDKRSGDVIVRIVYDGAPEAGKTTNIERLCSEISLQRRGELSAPGTKGKRTEFFDWMDFTGGYVGGHRLRCQLVTVPGQSVLLRRRRYLLESADSVVFVASSAPALVEKNRQTFEALSRSLARASDDVPVGIVVQANKQDLDDALSPDELVRAMGLDAGFPVVASQAQKGSGVTQTFMVAVRLAADRVRKLMLAGAIGDVAPDHDTPEALYEAMKDSEVRARERMSHRTEGGSSYEVIPVQVEEPVTGRSPRPPTVEPETAASDAPTPRPPVPDAPDILAGCAWPPVHGRTLLARINCTAVTQMKTAVPWAPESAIEVRSDVGWLLHTRERWLYQDLEAGRRNLMKMVRRLRRIRRYLPKDRALVLAPEERGYRLWMLSPAVQALRTVLADACSGDDTTALAAALESTAVACSTLSGRGLPEMPGSALESSAVRGHRVFLVTVPREEAPLHELDLWTEVEALLRDAIESSDTMPSRLVDAMKRRRSLPRASGHFDAMDRLVSELTA